MKKVLAILMTFTTAAAASSTYLLPTGDADAERLRRQHEIMLPASQEHLGHVDLQPGQTVMDIGCGTGLITLEFAKAVGDQGRVYAVDISAEALESTRKAVEEARLSNVSYLQADIQAPLFGTLADLSGTIDITYSRFVLMHLDKPEMAVANTVTLLKPGGRAACQESMLSSTQCTPDNPMMNRYYQAGIALGKSLGQDKNIGERLDPLFESTGCDTRNYYQKTFNFPLSDAIHTTRASFQGTKAHYVTNNILTQAEAHEIEGYLAQTPPPEIMFSFKQGYIIAQKPVKKETPQ